MPKTSPTKRNEPGGAVGQRSSTLGLELVASWFRDLVAAASGASEVAYNQDRIAELQAHASTLDPTQPRRAAELVQDTRRRLDLNVSEELALEALSFRLAAVFA